MKSFLQPGDVVPLIAPEGGVLSGQPILVGSIFGVAAYDAAEGDEVEAQVVGVFELPKASGAITQGALIYFDADPGVLTATATDNVLIGAATEAAATGFADGARAPEWRDCPGGSMMMEISTVATEA
ncbi:MAG: DUF2190 family protein [Methyloceanibacter sp.]